MPVRARSPIKRKSPKKFNPDRNYLKKVISDERRIHRARAISHKITALKLKAAATGTKDVSDVEDRIKQLQSRQERLLEGITDKAILQYAKEQSSPLTNRGTVFVSKRGARLLFYDLLSKAFGWAIPAKTHIRLALRAKDLATDSHMKDIVPIALAVWKSMPDSHKRRYNLTEDSIKEGAVLHDVGKLEVPSHILRKTARLTEEEWDRLREHTTAGERLLEKWGADSRTIKAARQHHMYPKGGYPNKRPGEKMSQIGRLIDLVDAIEKMSSARHGKDPMPLESIIEEVKRETNQFYSPYVKAFIKATNENPDFMKWWEKRANKMANRPSRERLAPRKTSVESGVVRYAREEGARRFDQNR
ncbi:MAG: hypothetical protein COT15_02875 [Candidatus Diapherotrites archaeon CG08_land_8_20_14_0_20_34_12]|nr:MAG: hypothetical protein COT15_02875 [Candidatus Diapherotrites archaeon CG08_land_8_20_14_0_20_34_12]